MSSASVKQPQQPQPHAMAEEKEGLPFHHASTSAPHIDGAFNRKLDPKEQARMEAMMANLNAQASQFITKETDQSYTLPRHGEGEQLEGGALNLKAIPTLYFKGCRGCAYTVDHRTVKVLIEDCQDCSFTLNNSILTSSQTHSAAHSRVTHCRPCLCAHTLSAFPSLLCFLFPLLPSALEAWKCRNLQLTSAHQIKTMQLDLSHTVQLTLPSLSDFGTIVHNSVEQLSLTFRDTPEHSTTSGYSHLLPLYPDSNLITDQFIVRLHEGALLHERCIRLNNGFLSTEREAVEWERKNELAKERYVERFLKEGGITIKRKAEKKVAPNDPCPCESGKKYKVGRHATHTTPRSSPLADDLYCSTRPLSSC